MNIEINHYYWRKGSTVMNRGDYRVGRKAHKAFGVKVDGYQYALSRKMDRDAFLEYLNSDVAAEYQSRNHEGAHEIGFEVWLMARIRNACDSGNYELANEIHKVFDKYGFV